MTITSPTYAAAGRCPANRGGPVAREERRETRERRGLSRIVVSRKGYGDEMVVLSPLAEIVNVPSGLAV